MRDLRDEIFAGVMTRSVTAVILAEEDGMIAGTEEATEQARALGLGVLAILREGEPARAGQEVARVSGNPKQIALAEDSLIGLMAKSSGVATAARRCVDRAGERIRIVCGAWKKMPAAIKDSLRRAVAVGGASTRISDDPFIYLDKNYVRMLGGITKALHGVDHLVGYQKVIQIQGHEADIGLEAREAADSKADIIFVDTGRPGDIGIVAKALDDMGLRDAVRIAFGRNVRPEDIDGFRDVPVDILEIGRPIIDAPLLDLRMQVIEVRDPHA